MCWHKTYGSLNEKMVQRCVTFLFFGLVGFYSLKLIFSNQYSDIKKTILMVRNGFSKCHGSKYPRLKQMKALTSAVVVETCGSLTERIMQFNVGLDLIRTEQLKMNRSMKWGINPPNKIEMLCEWKTDFLQSMTNRSFSKAVILPWNEDKSGKEEWSSLTDTSNLLIQSYYESSASDTLCTWIETPGQVANSYNIINNWTCNRDIKQATVPKSLPLLALNAIPPYKGYYFPTVYPPHFFRQTPPFLFVSYIINQGTVAPGGDVYTNKAMVVPYGCFANRKPNPPKNAKNIPLHREILVLSQSHGKDIYHRMIENIPRVAIFVDFLRSNPTIKIHAQENGGRTAELLGSLGFTKDRIVTGWCRAEIVYLPRASMCLFANIPEIQILSRLYRSHIERHFKLLNRNKIVFIKRSKRRYFSEEKSIEKAVQQAANAYNLSFEIYGDNPEPSLNDTMRMFYSAVMVVGPHGAGLSNLVFSQPGTYVIEAVCNRPCVHLFFQRLALVLGQRWHGISADGGCKGWCNPGPAYGMVNISTDVINSTVISFLRQMKLDIT